MSNMPAGWYEQEDGRGRYWDGQQWTEHFAPGSSQGPPEFSSQAPGPQTPASKSARPWFKKKRFLIPGGLAALIVVGTALTGGGDGQETASADSSPGVAGSAKASTGSAKSGAKSTAKPARKTTAAPKVGSKVRDGKFEFVVTGMKCGIASVGDQYLNTKAQGQFCRATMKVSNIGNEAQTMLADNQLAFDSKGRKFSADAEASIYDPDSKVLFEEINPGNTVNGRVYFDVPKGTKLAKLELHDSAFSGGVEVSLTK